MNRVPNDREVSRRKAASLDRWALAFLAVALCSADCGDAGEFGQTSGGRTTGASGSPGSGAGGASSTGSDGSRAGGSGGSTSGGSAGSSAGGFGGASTGGATTGTGGASAGGTGGSASGGSAGATGGTGGTDGGAGSAGNSGTGGAGGAAGQTDAGPGDAGVARDATTDAARSDSSDARLADARDASSIDASSDGAAGCGLVNVVSKAYFDSIFPLASRHAVYTYEGFIAAAAAYPTFVNTGSVDACRREAAAFLANVKRETGSLKYAEQIAKEPYCDSRTGCACDASTTDQSKWYYGRGAIQLSWNYNYCTAGTALGVDILSNPGLVATTPELAWRTAIWFWMTSEGAGSMTCHEAMTTSGAFGETIRTINGGQECNMGGYGSVSGVTERVDAYIQFAKGLGIANPGQPNDLDC